MIKITRLASYIGARCRSPNHRSHLKNGIRNPIIVYAIINSIVYNMVEAAGRAIDQSATKFYTKNNREGRLEISAL